ncbi:ATP-binding protein [Paraburkholderia phytofirmans]|uniref:ATP-binding protein n=1 Tax=Paraburkholderia phytofirmans TaxID=261302 RepID=UPI0038BC14CD
MMQKNDAVDDHSEAGLGFTVDTHIFRELGDLLVGRDSTALAELIKNAYDADARRVQVRGTSLSDPGRGVITIVDDGHGMTPETFKIGFLRVAGRQKEAGNRRSPKYARRFTGEKGIGRLAAHKLAKRLEIISVPDKSVLGDKATAFKAVIDWDRIEELNTLDEVREHSSQTDLFSLSEVEPRPAVQLSALGPNEIPFELQPHGTKISLQPLRRSWTESERIKLYNEAQPRRRVGDNLTRIEWNRLVLALSTNFATD